MRKLFPVLVFILTAAMRADSAFAQAGSNDLSAFQELLPNYFDDAYLKTHPAIPSRSILKKALRQFLGIDDTPDILQSLRPQPSFPDQGAVDSNGHIRAVLDGLNYEEKHWIALTLPNYKKGDYRLDDYVLSDLGKSRTFKIHHRCIGMLLKYLYLIPPSIIIEEERRAKRTIYEVVGVPETGTVIIILKDSPNPDGSDYPLFWGMAFRNSFTPGLVIDRLQSIGTTDNAIKITRLKDNPDIFTDAAGMPVLWRTKSNQEIFEGHPTLPLL